jgi:hypothetical protein
MTGRVWLSMAVVTLLAGCRTPDPSVDLLEAEMRWLEDQLYLLDEQLHDRSQQLASCQVENASLRRLLDEARREPRRAAPGTRFPEDLPTSPPEIEDDLDLRPPEIELGDEGDEAPIPPGVIEPSAYQAAESSEASGSVRMELNRNLTGSYDQDEQCPGDEGLMVVIHLWGPGDQPLQPAGTMHLEVRDLEAERPPVAVWDLDRVALATKYRRTLFGPGIYLRLPWPNGPPSGEHLKLYVTYRPLDGEILRAERPLLVQQPAVHGRRLRQPAEEPLAVPAEPSLLPGHGTDRRPHRLSVRPIQQVQPAMTGDPAARRWSPVPTWRPFR